MAANTNDLHLMTLLTHAVQCLRHKIDEFGLYLPLAKALNIKLQMLLALKSARLYIFCMPSVDVT